MATLESDAEPTPRTGPGPRWPHRIGLSQSTIGRIWRKLRAQAAPPGHLQALHRPAVRGQGRRRGRPLPRPTREGRRAMRGRENPDPGPGPLPAGAADDARHARTRAPTTTCATAITSLFAAFNIADGTVISDLHRRHRADEFKKFLTTIDKAVPTDLDVHLVCDNYATHKTPAIRAWLARHPRFHMHFTPTGSSWINQVERWFGLPHRQTDPTRRTHQRPSPRARHQDLDRHLEPEPGTLRMDQDRRGDPPLPGRVPREDLHKPRNQTQRT